MNQNQLIDRGAVGLLAGLMIAVFSLIYIIYNRRIEKKEKENQQLTDLMKFAASNAVSDAEKIIDKNENINYISKDGYTALMYAARNNSVEILLLLLKYGANPNIRTKKGKTALDFAIMTNSVESIKILSSQ